MKKNIRISFSGKACSGKTTAANYLVDTYGFYKMAFADILKDVCREVFDMQSKDRSLLQNVGMAFRSIDRDVFASYLQRKINSFPKDLNITVDDLRFANELDKLKEIGFVTVRLLVDFDVLYVRSDDVMTREQMEHPSECELDDAKFDYYITNMDTLENLYVKLDEIVQLERNKT